MDGREVHAENGSPADGGRASRLPSGDELEVRRRAIELVGVHWEELSGRLARWLGQGYREDDSRVGEVALLMIRRYGNGKGQLTNVLRKDPDCGDERLKEVLVVEARWAFREVLPGVRQSRDRVRAQVPLRDEEVSKVDWSSALGDSIEILLAKGEKVWEAFCAEGIFDGAGWSLDEKWTAIAMMWDLNVRQVGLVRKALVFDGEARSDGSTRRRIARVRTKGNVLLQHMPPAMRREHDLSGRRHRVQGHT